MSFCFKKTDNKSKKLDLAVRGNMKHSDETADLETLDSLKEDLAIIKVELEDVSRNI